MTAMLSRAEKEAIAKELQEIIASLIRGCETLDLELAFGMFLDAPDFLMMGTDGTQSSYAEYLQNNLAYLGTCASFELTTFQEEVRVLDRETAIYSWAYGVTATLKTGEQDMIDRAGATFVFRRTDGIWKVVYYHEASIPPRRVSVV
jgi:hypothetical protein